MIRKITMTNFRGIRAGTLDDLAPLTVLVGPNGCGKSTVLDALFLGTSTHSMKVLEEVLTRRPEVKDDSRWLFFRGDTDRTARLEATTDDGQVRSWKFAKDEREIYGEVQLEGAGHGPQRYKLSSQGRSGPTLSAGFESLPEVRLILPQSVRDREPLYMLQSRSVKDGYHKRVLKLLSPVIEGLEAIHTLTLDGKDPEVHVVYDWGSVPLGVVGDGLYGLARLAFEMVMKPGSLALIEEPEINQHPRSLRMTARVLWESVKDGIQVVLSTHSLELIDLLLDEAPDQDLGKLAVCSLHLSGGNLSTVWSRGDDIRYERLKMEEDLR